MKLIPNKGYVVLSKTEPASNDPFTPPNEAVYTVETVSQDSPLCKVGDMVLIIEIVKHYKDYVISREDDIVAWVEF